MVVLKCSYWQEYGQTNIWPDRMQIGITLCGKHFDNITQES